ncbi:oligopeptide/dipeptide ABC transporter ATP-binding protein [Nonomuraea sp. NPDC052129]|uniref:ABC transporter ATP-binding protein n=1 Tax=Nonomuraea sp. NPDC052129 TaxID=3154651 RepID=UPI003419FFB2
MTTMTVRHLSKHFILKEGRRKQVLKAVDDVSFTLASGRTTALVGESGSGKSSIARMLAGLARPTSGEIQLDDLPIKTSRIYRRYVQMVFQDPYGSLNPAHTVGYHLRRPLQIHKIAGTAEELLERVCLPASFAGRYPHELSGGQRQRVAIARALAPRPKVLLADEPVSMLDVSIRLEILNLIDRLKREEDLAVLYVTHDLATARHFAHDLMVMYRGQIVESGSADEVILSPAHPYTRLLADAAPDPWAVHAGTRRDVATRRDGADVTSGCLFRPRCPHAGAACEHEVPVFGGQRRVRCVLHEHASAT